MRTGVLSTAWTRITGRIRRRLRKKEKKKIDKVRFFTSPSDARAARRDARALGRVDAMPVRPSRVRPSRVRPSLPSRALPRRRRAP